MANTHSYVSTMRCACENVDAFNRVGIYSTGDLDNGVFVTLTGINKGSSDKVVKGFEYTVAPASATSSGVWLVATGSAPAAGKTYFSVVGFNTVAVGMEQMKTVLLQCEAN